jgi:hypothetical protein
MISQESMESPNLNGNLAVGRYHRGKSGGIINFGRGNLDCEKKKTWSRDELFSV